MGTSQSKRDSGPGKPLVAPWAAHDPAPVGGGEAPVAPAAAPEAPAPAIPAAVAPPRRFAAFRTALRRYARTGNADDVRSALGHWSRTSGGGARVGTARVARAARTGGAALAGFAQAAAGTPPEAGALDIRSLAGLPVQAAIDRIVDAFCPPGIVDEDLARAAIAEALDLALAGLDTFDPAAISQDAVNVATLAYAAELVFLEIAGDGGRALAGAPSQAAAVERERAIRSLIREVADVVGSPILAGAGAGLTSDAMAALVSRLVGAVRSELDTW